MLARIAAAAAMTLLIAAGTPPPKEAEALVFGARETLADVSLSPDGTHIAFVGPTGGATSTLFTTSLEPGAQPVAVLQSSGDPERLFGCDWVSNDRLVCTIYAVTRDTEYTNALLPLSRVIAVDAKGGNVTMLSKPLNSRTRGYYLGGGEVIDWLPEQDGKVLMTRQKLPDSKTGSHLGSEEEGLSVELLDTRTLSAATVERPRADIAEYISDGHGTVRIMGINLNRGGTGQLSGVIRYSYRPRDQREWKELGDFNYISREGFNPYAIDYERNAVYGLRKKDGRTALYRISLDGSMKEELIFSRPDVDVDGLIYLGRRHRVIGVSYVTDVRQRIYFDADIAKLVSSLGKALPNQPSVEIVDASADEKKLLIWAGSDDDPGVYYVLDRATRHMAIWQAVRPALEGRKLATVRPITYPAADGTMIPAYLTMPPGAEAKNIPAIVLPHGGPSARDEWGFDWLSQFYAARGFAVLQPQFRGSAGFGDAWFQQNGFRSWKAAIGDVLDAGRWLVSQGIAAPSKLGIVGWSYGGYAALQSSVVDPNLFKAVVAIAPVTDLAALKEESRGWTNFANVRDFIGTGPHIREGSPAQNAARMKAPILLFHAELDRNVSIAESRLMDRKLREAGVPHELVTWDKLDHYLEDSSVRAEMLSRSDAFLRKSMDISTPLLESTKTH